MQRFCEKKYFEKCEISLDKDMLICPILQKDKFIAYSVGHKSIPPNFLMEIRVIIKIETNPCYPRICETFQQEWEKKRDFFPILKIDGFQKCQFFKSTNFEHFFTKISGNGPWVSKRNRSLGQGCSSTYMVVRLSNKRSF